MAQNARFISHTANRPWLHWPAEIDASAERPSEYDKIYSTAIIAEIATENRQRLRRILQQRFGNGSQKWAVLLKGGTDADWSLYDSDTAKSEFRQEAFFLYLFAANLPDCYGVLTDDEKDDTLFVPSVSEDAERYNGPRRQMEWYQREFHIRNARLSSEVVPFLTQVQTQTLLLVKGINSDSGLEYPLRPNELDLSAFRIDESSLHGILCEMRTRKTPKEIELMRQATLMSSKAHVYVMRHVVPNMQELQLEMLFKSYTGFYGGCRHVAYTCICACGPNGSILHYGWAGRPNSDILKDGDVAVLDMGAEYSGYATDITRSYPINGKFTPQQRIVHNAVVASQRAVMEAMRPGVLWPDMHRLSERVILQHLKAANILTGSIEELEAAFIAPLFMPHGLGHLIGMNVHDVGGYPEGTLRSKEPGLSWLRCGRVLEEGMVVTVEPGCYFNNALLDKALKNPLQARFFNVEELAKYRMVGGVRLEDDVLVTADGAENLTVLPTTVEEIEELFEQRFATKRK